MAGPQKTVWETLDPIQKERPTHSPPLNPRPTQVSITTHYIITEGHDHSHPSIHEIKVENDPLNHSGPSKADPGRGEPPRPPDNIMVELGEPDSEMLLVK